MTKVTFDTKVDTENNPAPRINKGIADDFNQLKNSTNALYDSLGFVVYTDTVHTVSNKQTLTAGIDNIITIVDETPYDAFKPAVYGALQPWRGNKLFPFAIGDGFMLRFNFKSSIANVEGYFEIKMDINGSIGDIFPSVLTFPKGANVAHNFSQTDLIHCLDTFFTNGANIEINPSHTMLIWDKVLTVQRIFGGEYQG